MIKAVIFDLDNTLVDFMAMKNQAVDAAILAMRDAGLPLTDEEVRKRIDAIYAERGIEFQNVFDQLLFNEFSKVDYKILASGIIAYRRAREAALVLYPHAYLTLVQLVNVPALKSSVRIGAANDTSGGATISTDPMTDNPTRSEDARRNMSILPLLFTAESEVPSR